MKNYGDAVLPLSDSKTIYLEDGSKERLLSYVGCGVSDEQTYFAVSFALRLDFPRSAHFTSEHLGMFFHLCSINVVNMMSNMPE